MNMGEVSPLKIGVPRPRPLGLVKRESIHFEDVESTTNPDYGIPLGSSTNTKNLNWTPGTLVELGRSKTEGDIKRDLKSMRDLQETLRQAALLNIVAAVNHDDQLVDSLPPTRAGGGVGHGGGGGGGGGSQSVGIRGASILGHTIPTPASKLLVTSSVSATNGEGGINIGHFSHNLQNSTSSNGGQTMPSVSQSQHSSTINQMLSSRTRTISIPRPRTQNDQGSFMHKSLLDAKESLVGMTTFRAGFKKELDAAVATQVPTKNSTIQANQTTEECSSETNQNVAVEPKKELVRKVSCIRGTGIDSNEPGHQENHSNDSGHHNQNGDQSTSHHHTKTKDEQRQHNVHQMQAVKRHIPTSKKKEIMKKLTDIAKCEAMDMALPLNSSDANSAPPIIIMSQQKEHSPVFVDTTVNRIKSMTSLDARNEEPRVPSNTRVQSETIDALLNHREAKKKAVLKLEDDLIIESLNGNDRKNNGVDGFYRTSRDPKMANIESFSPSNPLSKEPFFVENIVSKSLQYSNSPDFLELRPVEGSTMSQNRRRPIASRRSLVIHSTRDKLISPSPVVYEASFHRPKASMGQVSLVGHSVQASTDSSKPDQTSSDKPQKQIKPVNGSIQPAQGANKNEETSKKLWSDPKAMSLKHWGSTSKPPSNSPILRTEILDHLQCVGLVNQRPIHNFHKKYNFKASGAISNLELNRCTEDEFYDYVDDDDDDDDDSSDTPRAVRNNALYRKSKLYNAFRASEENLSNLVDNSGIETETMTGRSLLNPPIAPVPQPKETTPPSSRDPVQGTSKEPLYMGCSSRVSENDFRSQFHYVSEEQEKEAQKGASFKVMKAIDQDVYFDFQHKKYRKQNDSPLNTAADKPRMHFLKIKFNGEAKT